MIGIKFLKCHWCEHSFKEGEGHKCWCPECHKGWPMCNDCYLEFKKSGDIVDKVPKMDEVALWVDEKLK